MMRTPAQVVTASAPTRPFAVKVQHRLGLEAVSQACREWQEKHPDEVKRFRALMRIRREQAEVSGGWTPSGEILCSMEFPAFVQFRTARLLIKMGWHPEEARNWDRTSDGKDDSPLFKHCARCLLPEAFIATKEKRLRSHRVAVDLRTT